MAKEVRLPPGCGEDLQEVLLYNPYQQDFMNARRLRFCLNCKTQGSMLPDGTFKCPTCGFVHTSNLTAPRVFDHFLLLAGRGSGKTRIGAWAVREESQIPNGITWVMSSTFKILHDSTFPSLVRIIPPSWVKRWDPEHTEIKLTNDHLIAFRSLEDPERARGPHGVTCGWFDEAALAPERAYDVFTPTLMKAGGIVIATTTPMGFDWTYERLEKPSVQYKEPGYYFRRFWTEENPIYASSPVSIRKLESDKRSMSPEFFAQEYRAERRNATGLVYDYQILEGQWLKDAAAVKKLIPEWPNVDPGRKIIIGLDSGADHPFGAVLIVITEGGLVVIGSYLERQKAVSQHLDPIIRKFGLQPMPPQVRWAGNKNEANLRLEFGLKGVNVLPAENKHEVGIQRVQSWLYTKKLFFAYTVPEVKDQMQTYRYAQNLTTDGQKKKEQVFKFKDEFPDCIRYALMSWPELPEPVEAPMTDREKARWEAFDDRTRMDIEAMRAYHDRETNKDLKPEEEGYPLGNFFQSDSRTEAEMLFGGE